MTFSWSRLRVYLLVVLMLCMALAGGIAWLLNSHSGLRWVLALAQSQSGDVLQIDGVDGTLLDALRFDRILLRGEGWQLELNGVRAKWLPVHLLHGELNVLQLSMREAAVYLKPKASPSTVPEKLPASLRLPLALDLVVQHLDIESLRLSQLEAGMPDVTVRNLHAAYRADAAQHRLQDLRLHFSAGQVQGEASGSASVATMAPFAVAAKLAVQGRLPLDANWLDLNALAEANGDWQQLTLQLTAAGAGMQVNGVAHLTPTAAKPLTDFHFGFREVDLRALRAAAPATALTGELTLRAKAAGEFIGALQLTNSRAATLDKGGLPLTAARTHLRLNGDTWQLQELELRLLQGGRLQGEADWNLSKQQGRARLRAVTFDPAGLDSRAPALRLQGDLTLDADQAGQKATLALHDAEWQLAGELRRQGMQVDLLGVKVSRGKLRFSGNGRLSLDGAQHFHLNARMTQLDLAEFAATPATHLNAKLVMDGALLPTPNGTLAWEFFDSRFGRYAFDGMGRLQMLPGGRAEGNMQTTLGANRLMFDLLYGTSQDRLNLTLDVPRLDQLGNGLDGKVSGQITLQGTLDDPQGSFVFDASRIKLPTGWRMEKLLAVGTLDAQTFTADLDVKALNNGGILAWPEVQLKAAGSKAQHTLHGRASLTHREQKLADFELDASGGLTGSGESWRWQGTLDALRTHGALPLQLQHAIPLTVSPIEMTLGAATLALAGGRIDLQETRWSPQGWYSSGSFSGIGVRVIEASMTAKNVQALDTLRFGGSWQVSADPVWRGQLDLHRESGDWVVNADSGQRMGLREVRIGLQAAQDKLALHVQADGERLGVFDLQAHVPYVMTADWPTVPSDAPLQGWVKLDSADLTWLGPLLDSNLQSGGRLHLDAELLGTRAQPRLNGVLRGQNLRVAFLDQGVHLEQGELIARLAPDTVQIERLDFVAPYFARPNDSLLQDFRPARQAGHLNVQGNLSLLDEVGQLQVEVEGLPLAQRPDLWLLVSGQAQGNYANRTVFLSGLIRADAGLVTRLPANRPRLSDDVRLVGQAQSEQPPISRVVGFNLDLGEHFYLRAYGLESRLSGELAVTAAAGEPLQGNGTIATEKGVFKAYGQRLEVERGKFNFQGPLEDPGLNLLALRKGLDVEAGIEVTGTARHPLTRLVSTPDVPDAEKLSWIVLGRAPESGSMDVSLLMAAAAGAIGDTSGNLIGGILGVDELSISQQEHLENGQNQVMIIGKRLSPRAYFSYEQSLTDSGGIAKFIYNLSPRVTVVTRTGIEDAIDLFYSFRFY